MSMFHRGDEMQVFSEPSSMFKIDRAVQHYDFAGQSVAAEHGYILEGHVRLNGRNSSKLSGGVDGPNVTLQECMHCH